MSPQWTHTKCGWRPCSSRLWRCRHLRSIGVPRQHQPRRRRLRLRTRVPLTGRSRNAPGRVPETEARGVTPDPRRLGRTPAAHVIRPYSRPVPCIPQPSGLRTPWPYPDKTYCVGPSCSPARRRTSLGSGSPSTGSPKDRLRTRRHRGSNCNPAGGCRGPRRLPKNSQR